MDPQDLAELRYVAAARRRDRGTRSPYDGYARDLRRAHKLVRLGLLRRERFSEHIRGERRFYWWVFSLTTAGERLVADG